MKKRARSSRSSAIFIIVLRLLTHEISNLALQAMEKVPDVSRNFCAMRTIVSTKKLPTWPRALHVQGSSCCLPRELVSFDPRHALRSPPIGKRIWVGRKTLTNSLGTFDLHVIRSCTLKPRHICSFSWPQTINSFAVFFLFLSWEV